MVLVRDFIKHEKAQVIKGLKTKTAVIESIRSVLSIRLNFFWKEIQQISNNKYKDIFGEERTSSPEFKKSFIRQISMEFLLLKTEDMTNKNLFVYFVHNLDLLHTSLSQQEEWDSNFFSTWKGKDFALKVPLFSLNWNIFTSKAEIIEEGADWQSLKITLIPVLNLDAPLFQNNEYFFDFMEKFVENFPPESFNEKQNTLQNFYSFYEKNMIKITVEDYKGPLSQFEREKWIFFCEISKKF